mmetsp:Transcript_99016/g.284602  ORF Transcript_99016/g.284602 Transcript_99016/m.284602 type:complete len:324 (-) Transcript_99016:753-1724(-)
MSTAASAVGLRAMTRWNTCQSVMATEPGQSGGCSNIKMGGSRKAAEGNDKYMVISVGFNLVCDPSWAAKTKLKAAAITERPHTTTPMFIPLRSSAYLSSPFATVASTANRVPMTMKSTSFKGAAPGTANRPPDAVGISSRLKSACALQVTSGKHDRIVKFKETDNSEMLRLFKPMFSANVKENMINVRTSRQDRNGRGQYLHSVGQTASKNIANSTKDSTCCIAVTKNAAGKPCMPRSALISVSDRRNFMYKPKPVFTPKYKMIKPATFLPESHTKRPTTVQKTVAAVWIFWDRTDGPLLLKWCRVALGSELEVGAKALETTI